jgi:malonyl-CoA O-methyltransferase
MTRRQRIADSFSAAAATYENAAQAQAIAADRLAARVLALPLPPDPVVLEIGCGTGLLTRRLLPELAGTWTVTDLSPLMVEAARAACPTASFRVMDGEYPDVAGFDLIVSNLAAQWFGDLPGALVRLAACLKPGGRLVLTTLGAGSFMEWRRAHDALGLACGIAAYPNAADLSRPGVVVDAKSIPVQYEDGRAFLRALKTIGAATPAAGHRPLSPGALKRVMDALGKPALLTYEILTVEIAAP